MVSDAVPKPPLVLVANARMPSKRAQSLQLAQVAAAFDAQGVETTLLHARRTGTPRLAAEKLWEHYGVTSRARVEAIPCWDWIDRVPRRCQYLPARLQEWSFARGAARRVIRGFGGARVLTRELESARLLAGRGALFLELHRVPGGRIRRRWLAEALEAAAGVVAISGGVAQDLVSLGAERDAIVVEHDGFDRSRFSQLPTPREAREALALPVERPTVVYTGGLLAWKGVEVLVEASRRLDAQVVIAGGMDADVERIRRLARGLEHVRVDGFQPPSRVPLYLAAGDVGVVPNRSTPPISARYTSPLKVFEAMGVGLPLVVSDLPSLREVLTEEQALFVAPDDADALARGLGSLLADRQRRAEMSAALREEAGEHTWEARARRLWDWMGTRL